MNFNVVNKPREVEFLDENSFSSWSPRRGVEINIWWYIVLAILCVMYYYFFEKSWSSFILYSIILIILWLFTKILYSIRKQKIKQQHFKKKLEKISTKINGYENLNNYLYWSSNKEIIKARNFVDDKLKKIILSDKFIIGIDLEFTATIISFYKNKNDFLEIYDIISNGISSCIDIINFHNYDFIKEIERNISEFKKINNSYLDGKIEEIGSKIEQKRYKIIENQVNDMNFSNYHLFAELKNKILDIKYDFPNLSSQMDILIQKLELKENEILSQYNGKYPYADKKCFYSVKGLVVNKRTWKGEIYYDIDNGLETEFYVFDDVIEIQNLNGISNISVQDIFKTEIYDDSVILLYFSNGNVINFYFEKEYERTYFTKIIQKLKNKSCKNTSESKKSVKTDKIDCIKAINDQLFEKSNCKLHSFTQESAVLWWKIEQSNVWLRLGDWDNNNKLYLAFWSNYSYSQYHNFRYDNDSNKEFFKLYKVSSFNFTTFVSLINGEQIPLEQIEILVNEVLDFYNNHTLNGKTISDIINDINTQNNG